MITPRRTRLLRVPGLQTFQRAIVALTRNSDPWRARQVAVLVPSRAATEQLRRTLEDVLIDNDPPAPALLALPEILTRDEWYRAMHERIGDAPPLLSSVERHVCALAAAREAGAGGAPPPFKLRPGLIPSIVGFYDDLMRQQRSIDSFERLMVSDLEPSAELDRGARRLLRQTRFLAGTFRAYQRRIAQAGRLDEHGLRRRLIDFDGPPLFQQLVVTGADQSVDPTGLWPADFDLLTRLPGLQRIDVIATDAVLDAGLHERLVDLLPGFEEERLDDTKDRRPVVIAPETDNGRNHFVWRDREEEVVGIVRALKSRETRIGADPVDSIGLAAAGLDGREAVVFQRPLPYLYLAPLLFGQAGVPFESRDALPLAAEPYAAAVDLVFAFVTSDYSRPSMVGLLRSPHFNFEHAGRRLEPESVEAFDRALFEARYAGGRAALAHLAAGWVAGPGEPGPLNSMSGRAGPAAAVAVQLVEELTLLDTPAPASQLLDTFLEFLKRHQAVFVSTDTTAARTSRARTEIWVGLAELARAHRLLDDTSTEFPDIVSSVRRRIESQTFAPMAPMAGSAGVQLVDAEAAAYGCFREVFVVGLVDREWPEPPPRNIFYPASLLSPLGWPRERDRHRAARARFADLVRLPLERVSLSTFSLEADAVVTPSSLLEEIDHMGLDVRPDEVDPGVYVTRDDALARAAIEPDLLPEAAGLWFALRRQRSNREDSRFHGGVGRRPTSRHAVRALEQYLECPFKYFASAVLDLEEEPADEWTLTPRRRGLFLHRVLESFFTQRQVKGEGAITLANLDRALEHFRIVVDEALVDLPPSDRAVTRTWLLGSAAAAGVAERLFFLEVERPADVVERLVEYRIDGTFVFKRGDRDRSAHIRGVADRIDLFSDGTFRVIDYKASRAPQKGRALQLPVYARCAEQQLNGYRGRTWRVTAAAYAAFGDSRLHVPLASRDLTGALSAGEGRVIDVLDQIELGNYPPRPAQLSGCAVCPYPTVCRKDYVGED